MRSARLAAALLLLGGSPSFCGNLAGSNIIATTPFACDGVYRSIGWTNTSGSTFYIKQSQIWMGMSRGGKSDFSAILVRNSDNSVLHNTNWDHYADPTNLHNYTQRFSPDYMAVVNGDGLTLTYRCTNIASTNPTGDENVTIWYTIGAP